jgi:hypothetical protein
VIYRNTIGWFRNSHRSHKAKAAANKDVLLGLEEMKEGA